MGKKFECASDWLVLLLVMVAAMVLGGLLAGRNMWREIILYWMALPCVLYVMPGIAEAMGEQKEAENDD